MTTGGLILPESNNQSPKLSDSLDHAPGTCSAGGKLEKAYREMAADKAREAEAEAWSEGLIGDSHE